MINRRQFLNAVGAITVAALGHRAIGAEARRPNFIFILADDLGYADVGCYGSTFYETPNIDRLAAQGMKFTDGYASCPVCSPTRASILTGKYGARIALTNFIAGKRAGMLLPPDWKPYMELDEYTLAQALREAGYATQCVGKWHLGPKGYEAERQGFDRVDLPGGGGPSGYFPNIARNQNTAEGEYLTDRLTDRALEFIEANRQRPFFIYLSHHAVHIPLQAKAELIEKYRAKAAKLNLGDTPRFAPEGDHQARQVQNHAVYAAMTESLDDSVGRVMQKIEDLGLAGNTVIIFTSDNGGLSTAEGSPTSNLPLRAGKGWLYEGGIRVPLIVKWPGVTRPGSTCQEPVTSTDFYPTLLEMAGLPLRPDQHVDGVSFAGLLGGGEKPDRQAIYWHYPHYSNQGGRPGSAIRLGDWKLLEHFEDGRVELFNLRDDIGEKNDLSARMPQRAAELKAMLAAWRQQVSAQMPRPNPDYRP
jgi:arylsulfatase A-like enzyme